MIEKLGITPGPWSVKMTDNYMRLYYPERYTGVSGDVARAYVGEINANIIAAAPEMLQALIKLTVETIKILTNEYKWSYKEAVERNMEHISIIEKATGKTWEEIKELLDAN